MNADTSAIEIRMTPGTLLKGFLTLTAAGFLSGVLAGVAVRTAAPGAATASPEGGLYASAAPEGMWKTSSAAIPRVRETLVP